MGANVLLPVRVIWIASMPVMTPEELLVAIDAHEIVGLTIETNVFDKFGCNLEFRALTALEQLKGGPIPFILSLVTIGEVKSHIVRELATSSQKAGEAINQFIKAWHSPLTLESAKQAVGLLIDPHQHAEALMQRYLARTDAKVVDVEVSVPNLMDLYFSSRPPFSTAAAKKAEFPDAIALLSLSTTGRNSKGLVLAISQGGDWKAYAEASERVVCIDELPRALTMFNRSSTKVATKIEELIRLRQLPDLSHSIMERLERHVEDFDIEASSEYFFEEEILHSNTLSWHPAGSRSFDILGSDTDTVTVGFEAEVEIEFGATFRFSVRDSVDRDYVPMGAVSVTNTTFFRPYVTVTMSRDLDNDTTPHEVEVDGRRVTVDFGEVEPDWDWF